MVKCKYLGCERQYLDWIPVTKKKPKVNQYIIGLFKYNENKDIYMTFVYFEPDRDENLTHWMPPPLGPNGEKVKRYQWQFRGW